MTDITREPQAISTPVPESFAEAGRSSFKISTFASLRHRGYLYLWIGVVFTSAGTWMEQVATSWLVYEMTGSALLLGSINGMRALPFLFLGPLAGVAADRLNPKRLMLGSQYVIIVLYCGLVVLLFSGQMQVWHLFVFTLATSCAWSFNQPVRQALIPSLVPREDLMNAVALQSVGFNATRILGPGIGGIAMALFGGAVTFLLVTITWVGVVVTTHLINIPAEAVPDHRESNVLEDLMEGLRYIRGDRVVLGLLVLALAPLVFAMPYMSLMPIFAGEIFGMDASGMGQLLMATGVGAIVSTLAVASLGNFKGKGVLLLGSGLGLSLSIIGFALSTNFALSLVLLALVGLFSMAYMPLTNTLLQLATPQQYMGRVMSIYMLDRGLMPLGSFAAGSLAEAFGAPLALAGFGAVSGALILAGALALPQVRSLE